MLVLLEFNANLSDYFSKWTDDPIISQFFWTICFYHFLDLYLPSAKHFLRCLDGFVLSGYPKRGDIGRKTFMEVLTHRDWDSKALVILFRQNHFTDGTNSLSLLQRVWVLMKEGQEVNDKKQTVFHFTCSHIHTEKTGRQSATLHI